MTPTQQWKVLFSGQFSPVSEERKNISHLIEDYMESKMGREGYQVMIFCREGEEENIQDDVDDFLFSLLFCFIKGHSWTGMQSSKQAWDGGSSSTQVGTMDFLLALQVWENQKV